MEDMEKKNCACGHEHEHDEDCCCGHDHQYMTLMLEDNTEVKCIVIGTFEIEEYEGKEYIALVSEDGEESFVYEYAETDNEDGFELRNIDSDEEFEAVIAAIDEILDDEEEWDEDDEDYDYEDED
ncbi:MAG: DUF1292 domain-containing protein [Clostridia bacterium]|nr:DUF1292 domain-containing protein [Clostridia bacterium]